MRTSLIIASLIAVSTPGCFTQRGPLSADAVGSFVALTGAAISIALIASESATATSESAPPFDVLATSASLESIEYLDCGPGSLAELTVEFAPNGHVQRVTITDGELRDDVAACVAERFSRAEAPPFSGAPRALHCRIRLVGAEGGT